MTERTATSCLDPAAVPSMLDGLATHLPPDSAIPAYLSPLLITRGSAGATLFERPHRVSHATLDAMVAAGNASAGDDSAVRAASLMVNDLAVLTLRPRLTGVLGFDQFSPNGIQRWAAEVFAIYRDRLGSKDG